MTLFQTFVDAFEAERARYRMDNLAAGEQHTHAAWLKGETRYGHLGTRAECTRWIAEQAARKGFEAMAIAVAPYPGNTPHQAVFGFLSSLAAEPETTSGDTV